MEFADKDLRLQINGLSFKAYLEDSDITYETKDQQLPFVPTSFTNDAMAIRVSEKAKFTFNVFSETRYECVENYKNLEILIKTIKPQYKYVMDQLVPLEQNVTGLVRINFKGLPIRNSVTLHLNSFNYTMNKDLGYIHVPVSEINNPQDSKFYDSDMKLIPVGYKVSIEGKVLLEFGETANISGRKASDSPVIENTDPQMQERAATFEEGLEKTAKAAESVGVTPKKPTRNTKKVSKSGRLALQMAADLEKQAAAWRKQQRLE